METKSDAWLDGWHAHRKGVTSEDNPYNINRQNRSHVQWVSGWCARFQAEKHGTWFEGQNQFPYDALLHAD